VECGQDAALFWQLTFRETQAIIDGSANRLKREHDDRAWLVWHIEALHRMKRLPKLKTLLHNAKPEKKRQTIEEQIAMARMWTAAVNRTR